jgi:serine protease inhibitor
MWSERFEERRTKEEDFVLLDGKKVKVAMMHAVLGERGRGRPASGIELPSYAAFTEEGTLLDEEAPPTRKGFAVLEMPYQGADLSMVVLLPHSPDGLPALEKRLTLANLQTWVGKLKKQSAEVFVPRFKLETSYSMKKPLMALGMVRAFDDAQFDGMSLSKAPGQRLFLSGVLHKAFVEVNEKGTEAAAATAGIVAGRGGGSIVNRPTFRADRPFVFLIRDRKTGTILFLGRLLNPTR